MDELIKQEKLTDTQVKRREQYIEEEKMNLLHTRYPVRNDRRPLQRTEKKVQEPRLADRRPLHEEETDSFKAYEARRAARRMEFEEYERQPEEHPRTGKQQSQKQKQHAPKQTAQKKKKRKKRRRFGLLRLFIIAFLIGILCFFTMNRMMNPPQEELNLTGQTVSITIPDGAGTESIAKILKENKLIGSVFGFKLTSKINGFDGTYKQGTYDVDTGMTKLQIMELLQSGSVSKRMTLTIPEGYTVKQIAEKVAESEICTAEEFINECNTGSFSYDFLNDIPKREYRLEGYLFPDTYFLSDAMTAHDIIDIMLNRFQQMYSKEYQDAVAASGYTLDQIVTIASMVEKEIKLEEERATAAGVMYNRLKENISLGIDATVLYAVGKTGGELTQADLDVDSPYNTRKNTGLPAGPIANPGEASFKAALYPETHNYLYYVVEAIGKDNHVYCETYNEFLAAKEAYNKSAG